MSSTGVYRCCDDLRREKVSAHPTLNGIDFLVVENQQLTLKVYFLKPPPNALDEKNVIIDGGDRIRAEVAGASVQGGVLVVNVVHAGDFSTYTLRLVEAVSRQPLQGFDPRLVTIDFSFKADCPSDLDCRADERCPPEEVEPPRIDYLAKDYGTFRRLMLDRLALLLPGWRETTPADFGVTLVELLAFVADQLSYRQDAVATEAYLRTARSRTSVRRHARLVDYVMHDGCNARVFVHVAVSGKTVLPEKTQLFTRLPEAFPPRFAPDSRFYAEALGRDPVVFETMHSVALDPAVNTLTFYAWGSQDCCLPRGATSATLKGHVPLQAGQLLLLMERVGPRTGNEADADPEHRHVVRLTKVDATGSDPLDNTPVTEIFWDEADALPFPLCVSTTTDQRYGHRFIPDAAIARGNIVLADHGISVDEDLGGVPKSTLFRPAERGGDMCSRAEPVAVLPRFRPRLGAGPLTQVARAIPATAAIPLPPAFLPDAPAADAMRWSMQEVLPAVVLTADDPDAKTWQVRHDLLESDSAAAQFVADVEEDGRATLRFGDDDYGRRPKEETQFTAAYRVGNGRAGNVGLDAIHHIVTKDVFVELARNFTPARGGVDPESLEHARQSAPEAFRINERAVTEADYAEVTERHPDVDRAAATFRWTGSWYTVFDTIDRRGGGAVDAPFEERMREHVERYRVVGIDLEIDAPRFVPLEVALTICVQAGHYRAGVQRELLRVFRDFFDPDRFTFGQSVYLSAIVAAAADVEGVDAVFVDHFRRQGAPSSEAIGTGELKMTRLEVAQLANDRNFPDRGTLVLRMRGGL